MDEDKIIEAMAQVIGESLFGYHDSTETSQFSPGGQARIAARAAWDAAKHELAKNGVMIAPD